MKTNTEWHSELCMFHKCVGSACPGPCPIPVPGIVCTWVFMQSMNQVEKTISNSSIGRIQHLFCGIPSKNTYPESNHEEISDKFKSRNSLKNKWPMYLKNVNIMDD